MTSTVQALDPMVRKFRYARAEAIEGLRRVIHQIPWERRGLALMVLSLLEAIQADPTTSGDQKNDDFNTVLKALTAPDSPIQGEDHGEGHQATG